MKSKQIIILSVILLLGCSTSKKATTTVVTPPTSVPTEVASQGKELYENRCAKCHKLFAASDYTVKQWPGILNSMQGKAKITDEQKNQIFAYLYAGAKQ